MSDFRGRGEERLPWLQEASEPEDEDEGGFRKMLIGLAVVFAGSMLLVVVLWALFFREGAVFGSGQLIHAPAQPFREKPAEAGGMNVEGTGDIAYGASEGQDPDGQINLDALPEQPVTGPRGATASVAEITIPGPPPPKARPAAAPATAVPAATAPTTRQPVPAPSVAAPVAPPPPAPSGSGTVQLGAFSTQAKAQAAWKSLSGRFGYLAPLASSVLEVKSGSVTLYRLRAAAGGEAQSICQRLKIAGETCSVVG
jgi:hypothetical protein